MMTVAQLTDWRRWREVRLRALADAPDAFGETLAHAHTRDEASWQSMVAHDPLRVVLAAEDAGAIVGTAVVRVAADARLANLFAMWVAPEARGHGAGRLLVAAATRWARLAGASSLELRVTVSNVAAFELYRRTGFVETGERAPVRDGSTLEATTMALRLPPLVMGVVNVTPDSFSDGGAYLDPAAAIAHGEALLADGADLLDIGGEATNPRAQPITAAEELRRVLPVIEALRGAPLSIDTTKAEVARAAIAAGATIVNDVSGGLFDAAMPAALAGHDVTYIAGHLRGRSITEVFAGEQPVTWREVADELAERLTAFAANRIWVDPGLGFGKGADPATNRALIDHAGDLGAALGRPVVIGPSRKRFLRALVGEGDLDAASVTACLAGIAAGAQVVRIHDVKSLVAAM
ncbi:MAG TPA: dihydropteroate synthase [Kofleriaceae bacterium]